MATAVSVSSQVPALTAYGEGLTAHGHGLDLASRLIGRKQMRNGIHGIALIALLVSGASAAPIPPLDLSELVVQAELIVVATVSSIAPGPQVTIQSQGQSIQGQLGIANLVVHHTLKGSTAGTSVTVHFARPEEAVGYRDLADGTVGTFFLTQEGDVHHFVSPYYPYVRSRSPQKFTASSILERVIEAVAHELESDATSPTAKREAAMVLWGLRSSRAVKALRSGLLSSDSDTALTAAAALLAGGDTAALAAAERVLTSPAPGVSEVTIHNLEAGIREGVRDPASTAVLSRLLQSGGRDTRRAAIGAIRSMRSQVTIDTVVAALDDSDQQVRHAAVMTLAELTGQLEWGPSLPAFALDEGRYIEHWKEWFRRR